jgi:hypothetical protein
MASLLSGAGTECGPSNPLQNLAKTFGQDRTLQQVSKLRSILPHLRGSLTYGTIRTVSSRKQGLLDM